MTTDNKRAADEAEREAFEAHYANKWNSAYGGRTNHTAEEVADLRDGEGYGDDRTYLNAMWEGWQAALSVRADSGSDARDAERYRWLRERMGFSSAPGESPTMSFTRSIPAPLHDFNRDWVGDRFDASVDATIDAAIAKGESK